jgi:hypothetical protein
MINSPAAEANKTTIGDRSRALTRLELTCVRADEDATGTSGAPAVGAGDASAAEFVDSHNVVINSYRITPPLQQDRLSARTRGRLGCTTSVL